MAERRSTESPFLLSSHRAQRAEASQSDDAQGHNGETRAHMDWPCRLLPSIRVHHVHASCPRARIRCDVGSESQGPCPYSSTSRLAQLCAGHCKSRSEEHTSELQSRENLVCRLL